MSGCADPAPSDVRGLLGVELHEQLVREDDLPPADAQTVEVHCTLDEAELSLRGTAVQRTVVLASVPPNLRARVLALSIAELARPQPAAAGAPPTSAAASTPQEPPSEVQTEPEVREEDEPRRQVYSLWLGAEGQAAPLFALGGSVLLRVRVRELLAWSNAAGIGQARVDIDGGRLRLLSVSVRTGLALLLEGVGTSFHVGAGIRASWTKLSGEPSDATNLVAAHFDAWSVGPALFAGATARISSALFLAVELELDHLRSLRAGVEGGNARTLSPWRNSVALGAGVAW